jgi:hypothetical protein
LNSENLDFYGHQEEVDSIDFDELGEVEECSQKQGQTPLMMEDDQEEVDEFISSSSHGEQSFD